MPQYRNLERPWIVSSLLVVAVFAVYLPAIYLGFVNFDDQYYVTDNLHLHDGLTWANIRWAFSTFYASNWHPLTWLSHMLDCQLFGLNPAAHHFVNALIHAGNSALLFILWLRLTKAPWPAAFIAALFAWHPLHVESVAWIAERKDVLSTFFALLALLHYTTFVQQQSRRHYWLLLLCYVLSLLAKPMYVTLPFVLLLLDVWPLNRLSLPKPDPKTFRRRLAEKWPLFTLALGSCTVTYLAQREGAAVMTLAQLSLPLRLQISLYAYGQYLLNMIWPAHLAVMYPLPNHLHWIHAAAATSTAILVIFSWLAWRARERFAYVTIGWLWYLGTLVPVVGLVQVGDAAHADRYTYFPLIGIFTIVAFGARDLAARFSFLKKICAGAAALILPACIALTEIQISFWHDSESLFRHDLAVTGSNPLASLNLGGALEAKGKKDPSLGLMDDSEALFRNIIATQNNATAHLNLGSALEAKGRNDEALAEYQEALRLDPKLFEADSNIGKLLFGRGDFAGALPYCQLAARLKPDRATLHNNLGLTLQALGRFDEALKEFAEAARLDGTYAIPFFESGKTLLKQGRDAEALPQLFAALRLEPDNLQFSIFTARALASDKNSAGRDGKKALALATGANQAVAAPQPVLLDTLAMALAELGRFDDAEKIQRQAVELVEKSNDREDLAALQQRLELYQNHQPWRESFLATNAPAKN